MPTSEQPSDGVLHVRVADDLLLDGGTWNLTEDQKGRPVARITPPATPMFQQIIAYLEAKPVPPSGSVRRADEARAAVAVCLRWGSYFAVLADPSRPDSPNIDNEQVSQIDDEEMARMNIEISAALAWWLTLSGSDDRRYSQLVDRALAYLPTGPKAVSALQSGDILLASTVPDLAAQVCRSWPADRLEQDMQTATQHGIRVIANTITHIAWRNGPIENVHAGQYLGYGLNEQAGTAQSREIHHPPRPERFFQRAEGCGLPTIRQCVAAACRASSAVSARAGWAHGLVLYGIEPTR